MTIKTENYTGSDCTGSSGALNRVLTISNTGTTTNDGFIVYASGLALSVTEDYTIVHKSSGTEITFLNPIWDDLLIIVNYTEQVKSSGSAVGDDDFTKGPLSDLGVDVVRTPVTMTTDFNGNKKYTDGTAETISAIFTNISKKYNLDKAGLTEVYDAKLFVQADQTMNKYDKITYDSKIYRVDSSNIRRWDGTDMFKSVNLFYIEDE